MAKRFLDTGFIDQKWIRQLSPACKIFLIYLMLKCDNAGIIDLDLEDASFWIGEEIKDINFLPENYLLPLDDKGKYFMPKFIKWQYNDLSSQKNIVAQARQLLDNYGLINNNDFTLILPESYVTFTKHLPKSYVKVRKELHKSYVTGKGKGIGTGTGNGGCGGEKVRRRAPFKKPTLDDVKKYFSDNGYSETAAEKAFNYYDVANWFDSKGSPILNWKQKMINVWFKEENKAVPKIVFGTGQKLEDIK